EKPCQATTNGLSASSESEYKTLEFPFRDKGFDHKLVERQGDTCLVHRTSVAYGHSHFEVVQLRKRNGWQFADGRVVEAAEFCPSSNEWGKLGFTYRTLDEARKRFEKLAPTAAMAKQPLSIYSPAIKTAPTQAYNTGLGQYELPLF